ncbi:mRNA interferase MazF [Thermodesulfitimonas autotrophica]|uniref:mRNA interferase n=1 Tax=Thermodesulfitimonas autotrophica TaxID=1894989 RepID=A0A3N5ADF6_9THEO|nr:type II toxin-antitoxin system PemK/MazF family toxin [Thermodesulfitimonas autotrophica]RPF42020.1 mRNA interferase MazF [Thermodesulfitimonas autotrophica]
MEVKRGDVFLVDFNPARGSEQAGFRPALVIQNDVGNRYSPTTIVAAISAAPERTYPFLVRLGAGEGGLERGSAVNASQILTVDKPRLVKRLGSLSAERMREVNRAVKISLGLE